MAVIRVVLGLFLLAALENTTPRLTAAATTLAFQPYCRNHPTGCAETNQDQRDAIAGAVEMIDPSYGDVCGTLKNKLNSLLQNAESFHVYDFDDDHWGWGYEGPSPGYIDLWIGTFEDADFAVYVAHEGLHVLGYDESDALQYSDFCINGYH